MLLIVLAARLATSHTSGMPEKKCLATCHTSGMPEENAEKAEEDTQALLQLFVCKMTLKVAATEAFTPSMLELSTHRKQKLQHCIVAFLILESRGQE